MSNHTSAVEERIKKAERFGALAPTLQDYDWQAIVAFYSAVHWVGATYEYQTGNTPPSNHRAAAREYGPPGWYLPQRIWREYRDLQSYSETARYELVDAFTEAEGKYALDALPPVVEWAQAILAPVLAVLHSPQAGTPP